MHVLWCILTAVLMLQHEDVQHNKVKCCKWVAANFVCVRIWLFVCQPGSCVTAAVLCLSGCVTSLLSCWREDQSRELVSTQQTISNRANIQYQATCSVSGTTHSYLLSSLAPAHLLCISAFRSPTALWFMFPSLSLLRFRQRWLWRTSFYLYPKNHKTCSLTHTHTATWPYTDVKSFAN